MKTLAVLGIGAVLGLGACLLSRTTGYAGRVACGPGSWAGLQCEALEARSAAVFAGACHYMGEAQSNGREGLFGWRMVGELAPGVSVDGLLLAAAVEGEGNLDQAGPRRSWLWIDARADGRQARELERWARREHGALLGEILGVEARALDFERQGDAFRLSAPGLFELAGQARADRACCSMPEWRCYEPLAMPAADRPALVGQAEVCRFEGAPGLPAWSYAGENNVFLSNRDPAAACCPPERSQLRP
jgi:hypothetical protein